MVHSSQQFTPPQLLEAGHRAEAEGRFNLATQFYRHLTEYHAFTGEAAEARNGLGRINAQQSPTWQPNGAIHTNLTTKPRRRPIAPRDYYRTGRALARLLSALGWLAVVCGLVAPCIYLALDYFALLIAVPRFGLAQVLGAGAAMFGTGFLIVFSGQIARAVFDQANATRDLVALERAKFSSE